MSTKAHFKKLEPQTELKHKVLADYLEVWAGIMGSWHNNLVYLDGFAGEGVYEGDKPGSPMIALDIARKYKDKHQGRKFWCGFVEIDPKRVERLKGILTDNGYELDKDFHISDSGFEGTTLDILEKVSNLAPTFCFVDPCGWTGFTMELLHEIMKRDGSELLINFMFNAINRHIGHGDWWEPFFGMTSVEVEELRKKLEPADPETRERILLSAFVSQLRNHGAKHVLTFQIGVPDKNRTYFHLVHCCNHPKGMDVMKSIMWKHSDDDFVLGAFTTSGQMSFDDAEHDPDTVLGNYLLSRFAGQRVAYDDVRILTYEETVYLDKHYRSALKVLEKSGTVSVTRVTSKTNKGLSGRDLVEFPI